MVIQSYFNFENSSFLARFTVDQTGVLFWVTRYIYTTAKSQPGPDETSREQKICDKTNLVVVHLFLHLYSHRTLVLFVFTFIYITVELPACSQKQIW